MIDLLNLFWNRILKCSNLETFLPQPSTDRLEGRKAQHKRDVDHIFVKKLAPLYREGDQGWDAFSLLWVQVSFRCVMFLMFSFIEFGSENAPMLSVIAIDPKNRTGDRSLASSDWRFDRSPENVDI